MDNGGSDAGEALVKPQMVGGRHATACAGARDSAAGITGHKYGPEAGKVTSDVLASAGHTANAYTSYRNIAVSARLLVASLRSQHN